MVIIKRKTLILSLVSYLLIPVVFLVEAQYFTAARVGALSRSGYSSYLTSIGVPSLVLALLGLFSAFNGIHPKQSKFVSVVLISFGVVLSFFLLLILGASFTI